MNSAGILLYYWFISKLEQNINFQYEFSLYLGEEFEIGNDIGLITKLSELFEEAYMVFESKKKKNIGTLPSVEHAPLPPSVTPPEAITPQSQVLEMFSDQEIISEYKRRELGEGIEMQLLQKNNKIKALQTQLRRKKKSDIPAITRETDTIEITPEEKKRKFIETISGKVVALVNEANVFRDEEPPTKKNTRISVSSGLLLSDINSSCNVSKEKMSQVLGAIAFMWFGVLTEEAYGYLCPQQTCISTAIEKNGQYLRSSNYVLYNSLQVEASTLLMDESNKKDSALKAKMVVYFGLDMFLKMIGLSTDEGQSKKTGVSAAQTADSIENELGDGRVRITSCTCDCLNLLQCVQSRFKLMRMKIAGQLARKNTLILARHSLRLRKK